MDLYRAKCPGRHTSAFCPRCVPGFFAIPFSESTVFRFPIPEHGAWEARNFQAICKDNNSSSVCSAQFNSPMTSPDWLNTLTGSRFRHYSTLLRPHPCLERSIYNLWNRMICLGIHDVVLNAMVSNHSLEDSRDTRGPEKEFWTFTDKSSKTVPSLPHGPSWMCKVLDAKAPTVTRSQRIYVHFQDRKKRPVVLDTPYITTKRLFRDTSTGRSWLWLPFWGWMHLTARGVKQHQVEAWMF